MAVDADSLLRVVAAHSPDSIAVYDLEGRVLYVNPVTEQMLGKSLEEMRGKRLIEDVFPEARGNPFHRSFLRVVETREAELLDHYYPPFDRWFKNWFFVAEDRVHVLASDVTEEKRAALRSEALAQIFSALGGRDEPRAASSAICQVIASKVDADCVLGLVREDGAFIEREASAGRPHRPDHAALVPDRWPRGALTDEARAAGRSVLFSEERVAQFVAGAGGAIADAARRYRPSSLLVCPLRSGDHKLGELIVTRAAGEPPLNQGDLALCDGIAPTLGLFLAGEKERHHAASLRDRLAALADALPALVAFVDRAGVYRYVNRAFEEWFGTSSAAFLGRSVQAVMRPEAYVVLAEPVERALAGEPRRLRAQLEVKGAVRAVDIQLTPIKSETGELEGCAVLVQDVTVEARVAALEHEQREAERRNTERLEGLLAATARLAAAERSDDIARVLVDEGMFVLDAINCGLFALTDERDAFTLVRERGLSPDLATKYTRRAVSEGGPIADCLREGRPVMITSRADLVARYPKEAEASAGASRSPPRSGALFPLFVDSRVFGCLGFTFHGERTLTRDERTYVEVLASHGAEAIRRAELYDALADVYEVHRAMIDASPAAIILTDENERVQVWNASAERMFGFDAKEIVGARLPWIDAADVRRNLRRVLSGEVLSAQEVQRPRRSGEPFDAELHAAPIRLSDGRTMSLAILTDVSMRKRVERDRELLAEVSARLSASLSPMAMLEDVAKRMVLERPASDPSSSARAFAEACRIVLRDREEPAEVFAEGRGTSEPSLERFELTVPLVVKGKVLGELSLSRRGMSFDALDRSVAEDVAGRLASAVESARLFEEAETARREAEAASRAKDDFLAMLGHELRNPLAPIATALELMRGASLVEVDKQRAILARQVGHLTRLVDDLLDVSRIGRGKVELVREPTELAQVVAKAVEMTERAASQRRHRLSVTVPSGLVVDADPTRLAQVFANLLSNAIKYSPDESRIEIAARRRGRDIECTVADDGDGITADLLPKVFDVFVQAPQGIARTEGGLGLGLSIAQTLVTLHGGTILAESPGSGLGTRITVVLPADTTAAPPTSEVDRGFPRAERALRVLVVDDNEDAAELLGQYLERVGHDTCVAYDGPGALEALEAFRPDVAVLDIGLPGMDGYELAQTIRARRDGSIRLIALTGYGQASDRIRAKQAGFDEHAAKPVALERLVALIDPPS